MKMLNCRQPFLLFTFAALVPALLCAAPSEKSAWRADLVGRTLTMTDREANAWAEDLAQAYPGLVKVGSIGLSREGRRMTLLTVTDFSTGPAEKKRAVYIQGGIHSRELSGPIAALYIARRLAESHRSGGPLANAAFYIVPRINPDGSERMVRMPGDERSGWGEYHDTPNLIDMHDIDGDGVISFMRVPNPKGPFCASEKNPDCLVERQTDSKGPFYTLVQEGIYRNWDGQSKVWEDWWQEYEDYNRNYPYEWSAKQYGAGKRALDNPETANEDRFLRAHGNIVSCIAFHNGYGMVFSNPVEADDRTRYDALCDRAAELLGFPRFDGFTQSFGANERPPCKRGDFDAYAYGCLGKASITIELGTRETSAGLSAEYFTKVKDNPYTAPYAVIEHEKKLGVKARSYQPWRKFSHPQLGEVEIGGRVSAYFTNPLPEDLAKTCERSYEFMLLLADDAVKNGPYGKSLVRWPELSPADRAKFDDTVFPVRTATLAAGKAISLTLGRDGVIRYVADGRAFASANRGFAWTEAGADSGAAPTARTTPFVARLSDGRDIRFFSRGDALAVEISTDGGKTFAHAADVLWDAAAKGEWSVSFVELPVSKVCLAVRRGEGEASALVADLNFPFARPDYDIHTKALTPVVERRRPDGQENAFVHECKLRFALVCSKRHRRNLEMALDILAGAFERRTNRRPDIVDAEDAAALKRYPLRILVGDTPETRTYGVIPERMPEQGFEIRTFPEGLIVCGFDSRCMPGWRKGKLDNRGDSLGTYFGAIDFAERFLGIRWYFPGRYGTVDPGFLRHFAITPVHYGDSPVFDRRCADRWFFYTTIHEQAMQRHWEPYMGKVLPADIYDIADKWRCFGVKPRAGGHCPEPRALAKKYPNDIEKLFFRSPSDGRLWYNPKEHIGNYFNVFDLGFADFIVEGWKRHYATEGEDSCFGGNLSATTLSFGLCDTGIPLAEARAVPVVKELDLISDDDVKADRRLANVYGRFFRHLALRAKKEFPDKKMFVLCYADAAEAPSKPEYFLPDNVEIMLCDGRMPLKIKVGDGKAPAETIQRFTEWYNALGGRPAQRMWLYGDGLDKFARAVGPTRVCLVPKALGKLFGREEMFYDFWQSGEQWHVFYSTYVMYKGMWNPELDTQAMRDELWLNLFGAAAVPHLRKFYETLDVMHDEIYVPVARGTMPPYPLKYVDTLDNELKAVAELVKGDEVRERRLALVRDYFTDAFERERNRATYVPPVYGVKAAVCDVKLDGVPDEPFWQDVPPMPLRDPKGGNQPPYNAGKVRFCRDAKGIWCSFVAPYRDVSSAEKGVWNNDTLEFLFAPGEGKEILYHLTFDAVGQTDIYKKRLLPIVQPADRLWKPAGVLHKAHRGETAWSMEIFFPYAMFEEPVKDGEKIAFNFAQTSPTSPRVFAGSAMTLGNNLNTSMYGYLKMEERK